MYTILNERALIRIGGKDKIKFLQAIITNDVNQLNEHNAIYACLLTPQGKYFTDLFLKLDQDDILMDIPKARIAEILQKLKIYKLRSDVTFTEAQEYQVVASTKTNHPNFFKDPRSSNLGWRGFIEVSEAEKFECDQNAYELNRIENFIAEGEKDLVSGQSFPLEYGLDNLNAIDYKKGCYVGQELVARTHYLGEIRKQIVQVTSNDNLPILGTVIYAGEQKLGIICSSIKNKGLALIRTENVVNLDPAIKITADGQEIKLKFKENK